VEALASPGFAFRDGRVRSERGARRVRSFRVGSKSKDGVSVGSSEHFALPKVAPQLREVNVYLGWFGPLARPMQVLSLGMSLPGAATAVKALGGASSRARRADLTPRREARPARTSWPSPTTLASASSARCT
jgi:hypothetical protein